MRKINIGRGAHCSRGIEAIAPRGTGGAMTDDIKAFIASCIGLKRLYRHAAGHAG